MPELAALVGDLVGSRQQTDRRQTQRQLTVTLDQVNSLVESVEPLEPTIGDEFQGVYDSVSRAVVASVLVRLKLRSVVDSRYGIGWGALQVFETSSSHFAHQDGPGWWAARDAIVKAKAAAENKRFRNLRTWFSSSPADATWEAWVNAFLMCRDEAIGNLNARGDRILFGLLLDQTLTSLAAAEGITVSAVTQFLSRNGLFMIAESHNLEGGKRPWDSSLSGS